MLKPCSPGPATGSLVEWYTTTQVAEKIAQEAKYALGEANENTPPSIGLRLNSPHLREAVEAPQSAVFAAFIIAASLFRWD
jgi:hypothetical protein